MVSTRHILIILDLRMPIVLQSSCDNSTQTIHLLSPLKFYPNLKCLVCTRAELAYDTTFNTDGTLTCTWIDQDCDWNDPILKNRAGESLNLATNYLTDMLHTLYQESTAEAAPPILEVFIAATLIAAGLGSVYVIRKRKKREQPP